MSPKNNVLTSEQISPENYTSNIPSLSPTRVSQSDQDKKGKRKTKRQKLDEQTVNSKFSETKKSSFEENEFDADPDELSHNKNNAYEQLKDEEMNEHNGTNCEQQSDDWETYSSTIEPIYPNYSNGPLLHSTSVTGIINPFTIFVPNPSEYRNLQNAATEHSLISNLSDYYAMDANFNNSAQQLPELNNYHNEEMPTTSRPFTLSGFLQNTYQNTSIPPSIISNNFLMEDNFLDFFASDGASTIKLD